jgi:hypothetical protein
MSSILRAFENDAFISHNSFDGASKLAETLTAHGAKVSCDEATDLSDRRVRDRISAALMRSRCVVVYASAKFRDSAWCRAEYEPALRLGNAQGFERVAVARGDDEAPLPPSLSAVRQFNLPHETAVLADFLLNMNTVPKDIAAEVIAQQKGLEGFSLGTDQPDLNQGVELIGVASMLQTHVDRKEVPDAETLEAAERLGRRFVNSAQTDERTNGHRILILVAALRENPELLDDIKSYVRREPSPDILIEILHVYLNIARLPAEQEDLWLAASLLRATSGVKTIPSKHEFLLKLPDPVRCRVMQGRIGLGILSIFERATLLDRRLEHLIASNSAVDIEPLEIEGSLREFLPYIDMKDPETGLPLREVYCKLVVRVLIWAEQSKGEPLRKLGEYVCDVLLDPLARLMTEKETSLGVFEWACQLIEEQTEARELVNRLRVMGHLVRAGVSWESAQAQTDEAWEGARQRRLPWDK